MNTFFFRFLFALPIFCHIFCQFLLATDLRSSSAINVKETAVMSCIFLLMFLRRRSVALLFLLLLLLLLMLAASAAAAVIFVVFAVTFAAIFLIRQRESTTSRRHSFIFVGELIATEMKNIKWLDLWRREVKIGNRV